MTKKCIPIFFVGCVQSSAIALNTLLCNSKIDVKGVLSVRKRNYNSDFVDISKIAEKAGVPVYFAEQIDSEKFSDILYDSGAEIGFAIGWSRLIEEQILSIPPLGFIGFHPSALPQNRGRHPLIWALALGLEKTASTLFLIDEGTDSGPIISQIEIEIDPDDDAQSLYDKILAVLPRQINSVIDDLAEDKLIEVAQNHSLSNYWRKRSAPDGVIDWRMSASAIYNLTRALTHPYFGAEFRHGKDLIKLWRCEVIIDDVPYNAEPGKVIRVDDRGPVIKTGFGREGGAVRLLETDPCPKLCRGDYL